MLGLFFMFSRSYTLKFLCLFGTSALSVAGFVFCGPEEAIMLIKHGGYWLMLLAFCLLLCQLAGLVRAASKCDFIRGNWRHWRGPVLFVLAVAGLLLGMNPKEFKVTMDEPVLAATALQMHQQKQVMTAARAYEVNGSFVLLGGYVDKRPYFYPFLVSLLHDLTGYRSLQGVVLNACLTPLFLTLLFVAGRLIWQEWGGYLAVGLFATVPLLAMNANGAGFDLLNLVMILGTALAAYWYLRQPDARRMNVLILMGVLLAQSRYESVLYVVAIALVVAFAWFRQKEIRLTKVAVIAPLLLISFPLQRSIMNAYEGLWQLDHQAGGAGTPFSLAFVLPNLRHAGEYFFAMSRDQPNSWLLSVLFLAALLAGFYLILKRRVRLNSGHAGVFVCLVFAAVVVGNFFLLMAYHWGQLDDIIATRLVLPLLLFQVAVVVVVLGAFRKYHYAGPVFMALVALFFVSVTRPLCARSDFLMRSLAHGEVSWLQERVQAYRNQSVLFITDRHLIPLVEQVSGLPIKDAIAGKRLLDLHQQLRTFGDILIVYLHVAGPAAAEASPEHIIAVGVEADLNKAFEMEMIEETKLNNEVTIRLARLKRVRIDAADRFVLDVDGHNTAAAAKAFSKTLP
jgi:hypothetical protein